MHAAIRRYEGGGGSTDDLALVGRRLGAVLSQMPGFVVALALEVGSGALLTVSLFEDPTSLAAAEAVATRWITEHSGASLTSELATGEVVAQKGL